MPVAAEAGLFSFHMDSSVGVQILRHVGIYMRQLSLYVHFLPFDDSMDDSYSKHWVNMCRTQRRKRIMPRPCAPRGLCCFVLVPHGHAQVFQFLCPNCIRIFIAFHRCCAVFLYVILCSSHRLGLCPH